MVNIGVGVMGIVSSNVHKDDKYGLGYALDALAWR